MCVCDLSSVGLPNTRQGICYAFHPRGWPWNIAFFFFAFCDPEAWSESLWEILLHPWIFGSVSIKAPVEQIKLLFTLQADFI